MISKKRTFLASFFLSALLSSASSVSYAANFSEDHVLAIRVYEDFRPEEHQDCSGVSLGNQYILTNAHCFAYGSKKIKYATGEKKSNFQFLPIKELHIHPHYQESSHSNDIAILELKEPLDSLLPEAPPLLPSTLDLSAEDEFWILGYGYKPEDTKKSKNKFKKVLPMRFRYLKNIGLSLIPREDPMLSVCTGDSGGATIVKKGDVVYLAGVVLGRIGKKSSLACDRPSAGNINEFIPYHRDWINSLVPNLP